MTLVSIRRTAKTRLVTATKPTRKQPNIRAIRIGYDLEDPLTRSRAIEEICVGLEEAQGNVLEASKILLVRRDQITRWVARTPELRERLNAIRVKFGHDWAEEPDEIEPS